MAEPRGFIRTGQAAPKGISPDQKAQLLRKGNELFNAGKYELAERIFVTLGYSDGLARLGDVYFRKSDYQKAADLYRKAPDPVRFSRVCKRMAEVLRVWLKESATVVEVPQGSHSPKEGSS